MRIPALTILALAAVTVASCGQNAEKGAASPAEPQASAATQGQVWAAGSSTVFPFATRVSETVARTSGGAPAKVESLGTGGGWECWIGNDGRVRDIRVGESGLSARDDRYSSDGYSREAAGQWNAEDYARARATTRTPADDGYTYREQPAYPGGPVSDEEEWQSDETGGEWQDDGRYTTAAAPTGTATAY